MSGGAAAFAHVTGYGLRMLARMMYEGVGNKGDVNQARHYRDPSQKSGLTLQSFFMGPTLAQGVVTDATSIAYCYRVSVENMATPLVCMSSGLGSYSSAGVRDINTIQPGTRVLVCHHPQLYYGIILCTLPNPGIDGKLQLHNQLLHATRNRVDEGHKQPLKQGGRGFVPSFTSGRLFDANTIGESGFMAETGVRIHCDPFMAQLAVDEACGVFAFFHDQLLRIAGYNLRMFTAGMEREGMDDQGEYNDWSGYTPFPWEQMGLYEPGDPVRAFDAEEWQRTQPHYGAYEPLVDAQCPWHREREFHGYLGQGGKRTVQTKPVDPPEQSEFLYPIEYPGVADDTTMLDGGRFIVSAKRISIARRPAIQSPSRMYVPEQTEINKEGDNPENYRAAGLFGSGPDHYIKAEIRTQADNPELNRAAGVLDMHAYWFNFGTFHPFFYHEKDWKVTSEEELAHTEGKTIEVPDYSQLEGSMFLSAPDPITLQLDHRYPSAQYWLNESGIDFLEDGGVELYDGWGTEIRMTAGSGWFTAPADIWLNPGRNVNIWGGDDVNVRANNSLDLIASNKDVRIKAERNFHSLSGNGGEGGTLIECRAPDKFDFDGKCGEDVVGGGVFLRSEKGTIGGWGSNVYWRVGGGDINGGIMMLDADKGAAPLITFSSTQHNYVKSGVFWHLNSEGEIIAPAPTASITDSGTTWPGNMCCDGGAIFGADMVVGGNVAITGGYAATESPFVGELQGEALETIRDQILNCRERINYNIPEDGQNFFFDFVEPAFYQDDKPGDDTVIQNTEFSLRTVTQYGTQDFKLYEMRWQQMGRLAGTLQNQWRENAVECRADPETYPYPGKENFQNETYYEQELALFVIAGQDGAAANHGQQPVPDVKYQDPVYQVPQARSLDSYKVIRST